MRRDARQAFLCMPVLVPEATVITDACAGPEAGPGCAWPTGCGVGGIGPNGEWFSEEIPVHIFPWCRRRLEGGNIAGPAELFACILALRLWGPQARVEQGEGMVAFPVATDNQANTYVFGRLYASRPPLSWCLREFALAAIQERVLPAALRVPGDTNVVPDRLNKGVQQSSVPKSTRT